MNNNKQTAVEWLAKQVKSTKWAFADVTDKNAIVEQAKEMEKEQIMMAIKDSWYMAKGSNFQEPQEEQYYNETYGK